MTPVKRDQKTNAALLAAFTDTITAVILVVLFVAIPHDVSTQLNTSGEGTHNCKTTAVVFPLQLFFHKTTVIIPDNTCM